MIAVFRNDLITIDLYTLGYTISRVRLLLVGNYNYRLCTRHKNRNNKNPIVGSVGRETKRTICAGTV